MKVLLHLSDTFALPEFTDCRLRAMTSLAVTCPSPSAQYLTGEFYAPNYSLRQRMDVLEVGGVLGMSMVPTPLSSLDIVCWVQKGLVISGTRACHALFCCHTPSTCCERSTVEVRAAMGRGHPGKVEGKDTNHLKGTCHCRRYQSRTMSFYLDLFVCLYRGQKFPVQLPPQTGLPLWPACFSSP